MRRLPIRVLNRYTAALAVLVLASVALQPACSDEEEALTIYSGRSQSLVNPLLEQFAVDADMQIRVKYASSTDIASLISEEGDSTAADVVFLQSPGSLGSLSESGFLARLPDDLLNRVDFKFRSPKGEWVGTSGRARTVVYNTDAINPGAGPAALHPRLHRPAVGGQDRLAAPERLVPGVCDVAACPARRARGA